MKVRTGPNLEGGKIGRVFVGFRTGPFRACHLRWPVNRPKVCIRGRLPCTFFKCSLFIFWDQ